MSEDDYYSGVNVGIDIYQERTFVAEDTVAQLRKLLREAKSAIESGYYSRDLIERIAEELGDER